jgi:hypothetical protein
LYSAPPLLAAGIANIRLAIPSVLLRTTVLYC